MSSLMPGGKAKIVDAFAVKENIGRTVDLIEFVPPGESVFHRDGYFDGDETGIWIVEAPDLVRNTVGATRVDNVAAIAPQHLEYVAPGGLRARTKSA